MIRGNMAGYRRFIAYVYEYPQGKKGSGKGFIKVESRDGKCRMQYRLAGISGRESVPGRIYGYVRENGVCRGILLGECDMAGNSVQLEYELDEENMENSGVKLDELCGVVILTDSGETYGSGWDEHPVALTEIRFEASQGELPEERMEQANERQEDFPLERQNQIDVKQPEMEEMAVEDEKQPTSSEELLFSDNSISDCVKITPDDEAMLAPRDRGIMGNKFLHYAYANYGHLIVGRREEDGRYILGIPGIYESKESLMAGIFGFPYFKGTGKKIRGERLGYWYRLIDMPGCLPDKIRK